MNWEITYYISPSGRPVIQEFIDALPKPTRAKVFRQLDLLEIKGTDLGMPHSKALGDGLVELRVRSGRGTNEVRVFYVFAKGRRIFLVHGFIKKTQETPDKELKLARQRKQEIEEDL
jgi:phage-related protein